MPYDVEAEVDAAIMEIAQAFGTRTDKVAPIVDEYGCELALTALGTVQGEMRNGYRPSSPFGYMISLLRKGAIVVQISDQGLEIARQRWHDAQADPMRDTAQKQLARRKLPNAPYACHITDLHTVRCVCGCHEEFPSAVSG